VSWTDFVQGLIMLSALLLIPLIAFFHTGGVQETFATIEKIDPALLSLFGGTTAVGIVSALAWGLGYVGQPHIIVRFMAIQSAKEVKIARRIGIGWMILCLLGATFTALAGIAFYEKPATHCQTMRRFSLIWAKFCSTRSSPVWCYPPSWRRS